MPASPRPTRRSVCRNGNGVLTLRRDRLDITQFTGNVGGGMVTASGGVTYQPKIQYAIGLKGNDLRLLYPTSVRTDLGLNLGDDRRHRRRRWCKGRSTSTRFTSRPTSI